MQRLDPDFLCCPTICRALQSSARSHSQTRPCTARSPLFAPSIPRSKTTPLQMSPPLCVALADSSSAIGTCQNALDKYRDAVYSPSVLPPDPSTTCPSRPRTHHRGRSLGARILPAWRHRTSRRARTSRQRARQSVAGQVRAPARSRGGICRSISCSDRARRGRVELRRKTPNDHHHQEEHPPNPPPPPGPQGRSGG